MDHVEVDRRDQLKAIMDLSNHPVLLLLIGIMVLAVFNWFLAMAKRGAEKEDDDDGLRADWPPRRPRK